MSRKLALTPFRIVERGPYHQNDWRSRLRRVLEGWMPFAMHWRWRRIELAIRFREPLSTVPKAGLPLHPAWFTQADMDHANEVARELAGVGE